MGTLFNMTIFATNQAVAEAGAEAAFRRIVDLENTMSDYQADSELNLLCQKPVGVPVPVSEDLFDVLWQARRFSELSDGAFDATVGHMCGCGGSPGSERSCRALWIWRRLGPPSGGESWTWIALKGRRRCGCRDAIGPGRDREGICLRPALKVLRAHGISRALVAASGDIAVADPPPNQQGWRVAVSGLDSGTNAAAPL